MEIKKSMLHPYLAEQVAAEIGLLVRQLESPPEPRISTRPRPRRAQTSRPVDAFVLSRDGLIRGLFAAVSVSLLTSIQRPSAVLYGRSLTLEAKACYVGGAALACLAWTGILQLPAQPRRPSRPGCREQLRIVGAYAALVGPGGALGAYLLGDCRTASTAGPLLGALGFNLFVGTTLTLIICTLGLLHSVARPREAAARL